MVVLEGRERRPQIIQLPHAVYCEAAGECHCVEVAVRSVDHDRRTGERHTRRRVLRVPGTLVVRYREAVEAHEAILDCPGVRAGLYSRPMRFRRR